jgi:hypothetical protein
MGAPIFYILAAMYTIQIDPSVIEEGMSEACGFWNC